ncbi:hypothetical protein [Pseudomonas putida]|uniref:hypothetical protein n=1 Tax=Pseudomonas putida TaxID=303 RepID=UPI0018AB81BC|nr:hypothetical protein [Pseudomonas putida]MBF8660889.1 hypothetical protein [Pseudomonas putida]
MGWGSIDLYRVGRNGNESRKQVALGAGDRCDLADRDLVTQTMTGGQSQPLSLDPLSPEWLSLDRSLLLT